MAMEMVIVELIVKIVQQVAIVAIISVMKG
jgi:hypothetical protein